MSSTPNILVVTADTLGSRMAGPAIRAFEMAKAISKVTTVRLVSTTYSSLTHPDFEVLHATPPELHAQERWADVIIFQGHLLASHPWMKQSSKIIVADIYDPMHLEQLEQGSDLPTEERFLASASIVGLLNEQIERADYMLCASEKQRDFWLGQLAAVGRINPATHDQDASLRALLDVAPFGVADSAPVQRRHGIKGTVPGIGPDDKVIIWGGGIYNWFDPLTLIRAVHKLSIKRPDLRLFFLGVKHPNPAVPTMRMSFEAHTLARELGVLDSVVFFNEGWVPYEERADYLLDADVGVSTHLEHLETAFSFRTRILDYLWAGLPIVSTTGDTFAEIVEKQQLGRTVPPRDVDALVQAIDEVLYDDAENARVSARVTEFAATMTWAIALQPLIQFCMNPHQAQDRSLGIEPASSYQVRRLTTRVAGLEASLSWRITAPLRATTDGVRKLLGLRRKL
ncbi:glycosyltransferase family 4 protein [Parafrigoribacterium humi]|uniref:glycosyltransferase family 4 protein n=1 Tax=Parafrigoribacterium humi TaxID=3144664 RepID=UPI0032EE9521